MWNREPILKSIDHKFYNLFFSVVSRPVIILFIYMNDKYVENMNIQGSPECSCS